MPKKGMHIIITGKPRAAIDVDAMTQIVIALGRELAEQKQAKRQLKAESQAGVAP
jgi:hypothetical protein